MHPGGTGYNGGMHEPNREMVDAVIGSLGVPAELLKGEAATYAPSQAARLAFESQLKAHRAGLEFYLSVLLDPLLEAGRAALEEFRERQQRLEATRHERN